MSTGTDSMQQKMHLDFIRVVVVLAICRHMARQRAK